MHILHKENSVDNREESLKNYTSQKLPDSNHIFEQRFIDSSSV